MVELKDYWITWELNKKKEFLLSPLWEGLNKNFKLLFKNQIPRSLLITALCGRVDEKPYPT